MKFNKLLIAVAAAGLCSTTALASKLGENLLGERFIVHAKNGAMAQLKADAIAAGVSINLELNSIDAIALTGTKDNLAALKDSKAIASVELDAKRFFANTGAAKLKNVTPASHLDDYGWFGDTDFIPWGIDAVQGMNVEPNTDNPRTVCIVDTGYDLGHPDLQTSNVTGDDEGAGDWFVDGHGHGTHVAGTIAAKSGNGGVVGLLSESGSNLHIVRLFNSGGAFVYASDLVGAVSDCADAGSHVVNMSLGGPDRKSVV